MNLGLQKMTRWFEPKLVVFGMTLFNFVLLRYTSYRMQGVLCVYCPWFYSWSYFNDPSLLLVASIAILFGRVWSYLIALGLSGYLIGDLVYRFVVYDLSVVEYLKLLFSPYQEIIYSKQTQHLLALFVFVEAVLHLVKAVIIAANQNRIQHSLGADSPYFASSVVRRRLGEFAPPGQL